MDLPPIPRFRKAEHLDCTIYIPRCDHVVLESDADDLCVAARPRLTVRLYLAPIFRLRKGEKLDFAIVTSGCDHVVLESEALDC